MEFVALRRAKPVNERAAAGAVRRFVARHRPATGADDGRPALPDDA
jgi:hypothetical protein